MPLRYFNLKKIVAACNINAAKCYYEWYNDKYQESSVFEDNLIKIGAMMATDNIEEVNELIKALNTEKIVKDKMMEVISKMMQDGMLSLYYYPDEEQKRLDASLLDWYKQEGEKIGFKRGEKRGEERLAKEKKEMVINSYKENIALETISKICKISLAKVNKIIEDYKKSLK